AEEISRTQRDTEVPLVYAATKQVDARPEAMPLESKNQFGARALLQRHGPFLGVANLPLPWSARVHPEQPDWRASGADRSGRRAGIGPQRVRLSGERARKVRARQTPSRAAAAGVGRIDPLEPGGYRAAARAVKAEPNGLGGSFHRRPCAFRERTRSRAFGDLQP